MTLRPEYALGHSELNAFLFAPAGKDEAGQDLTVLSVLARLGLDPWAEAARLANLPREAAAQALVTLLCQGDRKRPDTGDIAIRLVDCLPRHSVAPIPTIPGATVGVAKNRRSAWLVLLAAGIAWFVFLSYMKTDPALEPAPTVMMSK